MGVRVSHNLGDLTRDLARIPPALYREGKDIVTDGARVGRDLAKASARKTAGKHGKRYPNSITADRAKAFSGFGGGEISAEYGPDSSRPQGGMSFEFGSRNQPPHLDLAKSADVVGPALLREVHDMLDRFFWAGDDR